MTSTSSTTEPEPAESLESFTTRLHGQPLAQALGLIAHRLASGTRRGATLPEELKDLPKAALKKLADVLDLYADQLPPAVTSGAPSAVPSTPATTSEHTDPAAYLADPDPGATYMNSGSALDTSALQGNRSAAHLAADPGATYAHDPDCNTLHPAGPGGCTPPLWPENVTMTVVEFGDGLMRLDGPSPYDSLNAAAATLRVPLIGRPGPVNPDGYESEGGPGPMAAVGPPEIPGLAPGGFTVIAPVGLDPAAMARFQRELERLPTTVARPFSTRRTAPASLGLSSLSPGPLTWPDHDSYSAVETFVQCGYKYLALYGHGLKNAGPPAWYFLAGTAAHAVIEGWELTRQREGVAPGPDDTAKVFVEAFEQAIDQATASDTDPYANPTTWLAANGGREDRAWWEDRGPGFVASYVTARTTGPESAWTLAETPDGRLGAEMGGTYIVVWREGERPVEFRADLVLRHPDGRLRIRDAKFGKSAPSIGSAQLDFYRYGLGLMEPDLRPDIAAVGGPGGGWGGDYWLGRAGIASEPKPLALERSAAVVHRHVQALERARQAHIFLPSPGNFCGNCLAKPLCPAFTADGTSILDNG